MLNECSAKMLNDTNMQSCGLESMTCDLTWTQVPNLIIEDLGFDLDLSSQDLTGDLNAKT